MCELLAANCAQPTEISFSLTGFCHRGGGNKDHVDGFGAAFFNGPIAQVFIDDQPSCSSKIAAHLIENPLLSSNAVVHIRKATQGSVSLANSHPFCREWHGRMWAFAHNGHLKWRPNRPTRRFMPIGETDSEAAFCWMMSNLSRTFPRSLPAPHEVFEKLADSARFLSQFGEFNFIMSDGRALYARCGTRLHALLRQAPFGIAHLKDIDMHLNLDMRNQSENRIALIATDPLTSNEPWTSFAPGELRLFMDGQLVCSAQT